MKERAYDYYIHHPLMPQTAIADFLDVSVSSFHRLKQKWNWPSRKDALSRAAPLAECRSGDGSAETHACLSERGALRDAAMSLVQVTRTRIDALIKEQKSKRALDHDKAARTLAAFAKTLTTAQALLEQEGGRLDDSEQQEKPSRSIHELRDELARHLERIVAEEEAQGSDGLLV